MRCAWCHLCIEEFWLLVSGQITFQIDQTSAGPWRWILLHRHAQPFGSLLDILADYYFDKTYLSGENSKAATFLSQHSLMHSAEGNEVEMIIKKAADDIFPDLQPALRNIIQYHPRALIGAHDVHIRKRFCYRSKTFTFWMSKPFRSLSGG